MSVDLAKPKISVVTVCYNSEKTIVATIKSIARQTVKPFEHIIIDGGSTDRTISLIEENRIENTILISEPDNGIYDALNKGIQAATGDFVGFLHSDDFFCSNEVIEKYSNHFELGFDLLYSNLVYLDCKDSEKILRVWRSSSFSDRSLLFGWMPPHPTLYVRREILLKNPFDVRFRISGDYDHILKIFRTEVMSSHLDFFSVAMNSGGVSYPSLASFYKKFCEDYAALRGNRIGGVYTIVFKILRKFGQWLHGANKKIVIEK